MREVDLELDFCPKCAPEETQNPFPVQEHRFYNSFAAVVQCTRCGTHYAASPRFGIIITLSCCLWFWGSVSLANSWNSPLTTIVLFLLALILYALPRFCSADLGHGVRFPKVSQWSSRNICCPRSAGPCSLLWECPCWYLL